MDALQQFLEKRPAMRFHYQFTGTFLDYMQEFQSRMPLNQQPRLATLVAKKAHSLLGDTVDTVLLKSQLEKLPFFSTADHAGLLNFGVLYSADVFFSALLVENALPYQIVLSTGRVPLNTDSFPRGFYFGGERYPLFPSRYNHVPAALVPHGILPDQTRSLIALLGPEGAKRLDLSKRDFLDALLLRNLDLRGIVGSYASFTDQLALINHRLWPYYFQSDARERLPQLLHLSADDLVRDMLLEDLRDPSSLACQLLSVPEVRSVYLQEFEGIAGCWASGAGTHFFWGVNEKGILYPLRVDHDTNTLVSAHPEKGVGQFSLEAESLHSALSSGTIFPSLFMDMLFFAFVEGYSLLGGFNQVNYLAQMRSGHERAMVRLGHPSVAARFAGIPSDGLICGMLPFEWDSGLDLIWNCNLRDGVFNGTMDKGLSTEDVNRLMQTPMKTLIELSASKLLDLVE